MLSFITRYHPWLLMAGLALLLIVGFVVGRLSVASQPPPGPADHDHVHTHADADADHVDQLYYCSMHPQIRSNNPDDTCPICGMDLIPMPIDTDAGDDAGDLPVLRLSDRSARLMSLQVTPVERRAATATVNFVGKLGVDETRIADLVARSDSYIEQLDANYLGKPVQQGERLAELYSPALTAAARELRVVQRGDAGPRNPTALTAARARLERLGMTADQVDQLLDAGELPRTYTLQSPIAGVVAELDARQGDHLSEGDRLARIIDLSALWLQLEAYEADLPWLNIGQPATFTVAALPGETFEGTVAFISPTVDDASRTARVRLNVDNTQGRLRPGMFARGQVQVHIDRDDAGDTPLLIPASAALLTGREAVVYVRLPDTDRPTFEGRQVTLGPRVGEHYIVHAGLSEGEQVVTHGAFKLDSELQIRGRPSMMSPAAPRSPSADELTRLDDDAPLPDDIAPYPLDACLVTDLPLDSMGGAVHYRYGNQELRFCCDSCPPRFQQAPDAYLPRLDPSNEPTDVHNH